VAEEEGQRKSVFKRGTTILGQAVFVRKAVSPLRSATAVQGGGQLTDDGRPWSLPVIPLDGRKVQHAAVFGCGNVVPTGGPGCNNCPMPLSCGQMMPTELTSAQQDEAAVAAVQGGDAERYRELVERHERKVFAVAWSRLGDAAMAEEVTQEAFIRAYRRLWLIGDGAKFSGWVSMIARRLAINFGLRHRRELNRRERWALEMFEPVGSETDPAEPADACPPEMLRQTLAELPAAHRECLVLFYLEGKSGAEAAAALGISESALRVRLHRARAVLRERLETRLEGSLSRLGPARTLVPAVMAGVLASASTKAATAGGAGAVILGGLAKFTPFKWLWLLTPMFLPFFMMLPGLWFSRWQRRDEERNFRDPDGFRVRLYRQFNPGLRAFLVLIILLLVVLLMQTRQFFGHNGFFFIIGCFSLLTTAFAVRNLEINRSRQQYGLIFGGVILGGVGIGVWLGRLPVLSVCFAALVSSSLSAFSTRSRPTRMDYNLFLRAAQGMLPPVASPPRRESSLGLDRRALRGFARFLGERLLVTDFRWNSAGLILFLRPINSHRAWSWSRIYPMPQNTSHVILGWEGTVKAHCDENDAAGLVGMTEATTPAPAALEKQVVEVAAQAWQYFRAGQVAAAERAIGQIPEAEIYVVPPGRTRAFRWQRGMFFGVVTLSLSLFAVDWLFQEQLSGMKPVSVTEAQVRAFLNDTTPNPNPKQYRANSPNMALWNCLVLPPTNLFSPEGLSEVQAEVFAQQGWRGPAKDPAQQIWLAGTTDIGRAITAGWLSWEDLGLTPQEYAAYRHRPEYSHDNGQIYSPTHLLAPEEAWSWVDEKRWKVQRITFSSLNQLRWLRDANCLDLVDRETLIRKIAAVQDVSATPAPGEPVLHNWQDVRGLFFTPGWPALQDTYYSVAALEILGGLDRIDREACIAGILGRHEGKGYFTSPNSGSINEYHIDGSARDTFAAFESLRILGALDRVKDLDRWQFRVSSHRLAKPDAQGIRPLTWDEVEAWVCQQRLANVLRERRKHPEAPVHSLLEPWVMPGVLQRACAGQLHGLRRQSVSGDGAFRATANDRPPRGLTLRKRGRAPLAPAVQGNCGQWLASFSAGTLANSMDCAGRALAATALFVPRPTTVRLVA